MLAKYRENLTEVINKNPKYKTQNGWEGEPINAFKAKQKRGKMGKTPRESKTQSPPASAARDGHTRAERAESWPPNGRKRMSALCAQGGTIRGGTEALRLTSPRGIVNRTHRELKCHLDQSQSQN